MFSYHQDYTNTQLALDMAVNHVMYGKCAALGMTRWLYERDRVAFALYMETYVLAFNKVNTA